MNNIYIFLVIGTRSDELQRATFERHLHMWVGKYSDDESYRSALAWVEMFDSFLQRDCVVYREVQGLESEQFKSNFNPITSVFLA